MSLDDAYLERVLELPSLAPSEFPAFFEAINGVTPFPWQVRLCDHVTTHGQWPSEVCVPCGCGKSAAIEIAVFHLALEASLEDQRRAPVRIAHVTNRRLTLNAAHDRAQKLAKALSNALSPDADPTNITARVARRLAYLSRSSRPLLVRTLEAGVPEEGDWTPTPFQPTVICTSVDQFGSRLLFRGYGVSASMLPLQAGLLGVDCLVLLDEPQLCEGFRQTLSLVESYRRPPWCEINSPPWQHVTLRSLTSQRSDKPFSLDAADREHPLLSQRLRAAKPARLVLTRVPSTAVFAHARELVSYVPTRLKIDSERPVVGLIVNTVELARACHTVLEEALGTGSDSDIVLLIGRSRGFDRMRYLQKIGSTLTSNRSSPARPLYVIATQCIEVGADIDFDILITQIAPLDTLVQRFGRLNRLGRSVQAKGVIVACRNEVNARASDPIYGSATKATWDWLDAVAVKGASAHRAVDFGTEAIDAHFQNFDATPLLCPATNAPVIMPAHLDLLSQTTPPSAAAPEIGLLLHGVPDTGDVQIIWRRDIDLSSEERIAYSITALAEAPPHPLESIAIPVAAVRAWLERAPSPPFGDIEGASMPSIRLPAARQPIRRAVLRWRGHEDEGTQKIYPRDLLAGDVIVVPSFYGGVDELGWADFSKFSKQPVRDVSDDLGIRGNFQSPIFRLDRSELEFELTSITPEADGAIAAEQIWTELWRAAVTAGAECNPSALAKLLCDIPHLPAKWKKRLKQLARTTGVTVTIPDAMQSLMRGAIVFVDPAAVAEAQFSPTARDPSSTELHRPQFRRTPVSVDAYQKRFEKNVRRSVQATGVAPLIAPDFELAAALAPQGARDRRYQAYLRGGDRQSLYIEPDAIMTSTVRFESPHAARRARERVGLPNRWCREAAAVSYAQSLPQIGAARDWRLVLWLIGTHFGSGRPFYPHVDLGPAGPQDLEWLIEGEDWCQIFRSVRNRYGWWGSAYLETIFRLAEHRIWEM